MKRGDIFHYVVGSHRLPVVVLTGDRYHPDHGLVAPLRERAMPGRLPAFLVPLSPQDWPTAAVIDLSKARALDSGAVDGQAGQLTPPTLTTLGTAIRTYFAA